MKFSIPFNTIELGKNSFHIYVNAFIGELPLVLIIDSGASKSVFDLNQCRDVVTLLEPDADEELQTTGVGAQAIDSEPVMIEILKIGSFMAINEKVYLIDLQGINEYYSKYTSIKIGGLLGCDFLLRYKVILDFDKKNMILQTN